MTFIQEITDLDILAPIHSAAHFTPSMLDKRFVMIELL